MPVNSTHADYKRMLPRWERCRDVCAGQDAVHEKGDKYLPRLSDQQASDYLAYVMRTPFYNATWRTVAGLVGMLFRKPMKVDAPESLKGAAPDEKGNGGRPGLFDDVDGAGQPLQLFVQEVAEEALKEGRLGVLADYPTAAPGLTLADGVAQGLRPTLAIYDTFSIINWRSGKVNNKTVLTRVVLHETATVVGDDPYEDKTEDRWRVLDLYDQAAPDADGPAGRRYRQTLYRMKQSGTGKAKGRAAAAEFEVVDGYPLFPKMRGKTLDFIPFKIIGTDSATTDVDDPPLIDLVDMNLSHYRTNADIEHGCHFTALPTLVLTGWKRDNPGDKVYLGGQTALVTSAPDAKATFCEFTGAGLASLLNNRKEKESQMAVLGARMLEPQIRGVQSPEAMAIHRKGEESMLSAASQAISLGMTQVLRWFADWAGERPDDVDVDINRDFYPAPMTPQMLTALIGGWQQGAPGLSDQGLFSALKAGELVEEDVKLEDEQARIADRQTELAKQQADLFPNEGGDPGGGPGGDPAAGPGKKPGDAAAAPAIHIHLPKGGGAKKITKAKDGSYNIQDGEG